jgi:hypothetical protein
MSSATDAAPAPADMAGFLTGTAMFFVLKLTTSVDDILWLSPFLAMADADVAYRLRCGLLYSAVCLFVTMEALIIKVAANYGLEALLQALAPKEDVNGSEGDGEDEDELYWTASRLMCIFASTCIAAFALKEWRDWREENDSEDDEDGKTCGDDADEGKEIIKPETSEDTDEAPTIETSQLSDSRRSSNSSDGEYKSFAAALRKSELTSDDEEAQQPQVQDKGIVMSHLPSHVQIRQGSKYECLPLGDADEKHSSVNTGEDRMTFPKESEQKKARDEVSEESPAKQKHTLWTLLVVAFFGTLDDLALFSAVLMGRSIQYPSLLCGSILAAACIVLISWGVSMVKIFEQAIRRIPLWALLFGISLYILLDGLLG